MLVLRPFHEKSVFSKLDTINFSFQTRILKQRRWYALRPIGKWNVLMIQEPKENIHCGENGELVLPHVTEIVGEEKPDFDFA